jgi:hypothetical protein
MKQVLSLILKPAKDMQGKGNYSLIFLMNRDTNIIIKYIQIKFSNTIKKSHTMTKLVSFQEGRMIQFVQIGKCNTLHIKRRKENNT